MKIELVYIAEDKTICKYDMELSDGATVEIALEQSRLAKRYPGIKDYVFGIFSKIATLDTVLKAGDRIEVYRPLLLDPKEKRRIKAKKK